MKILKNIITILILCAFCMQITFALSVSQAGKILDNFKRQEKEMIFESDILLDETDKNILSTYRKLNIYSNIGDKVQSKREYLQLQNAKVKSRVDSLESTILELETDIKSLLFEVNNINEQIVDTKNQIEKNKQTIDLLKRKISESTDILLEYMVYLYKKGEYISSQELDIDSLKTILLSGERIDELVNDLYFKNIIQVTGQQLIQKHRKYIGALYIKKLELQDSEKNLKALRKKGILEKNILDDKKESKKRLLEITKGQEKLYDKYIEDKLAVERDVKIKELREKIKLNNTKKKLLEKYGCDFVDVSTQLTELSGLSEKCLGINKVIYAEARLSGVKVENNPLSWPVLPYSGISSYFRDEEYQEAFGVDHDAIDIITPQGTEIKAPMDGYVIYVQPPVNTGYAYVGLKHSDNLVTLYGHISELQVGQYDFVKKGETFALSGGEYGTNGAGILTTGPHLHFVVYDNEDYADPLEYLNTSYLVYNELPEKYEYKYKSDFRSRKGYEYKKTSDSEQENRFTIEGKTEIERQKYLLDTYAISSFRDWDIWIEESISSNIDPTFVMCVGLAETGLGRYLKTSYNIGNVGNTDSGSTYAFANPREGIYWMTQTFNNKFLSQYDEIQELSRYGNKDDSKPIYASSDFNWHNNITKCMSHVKGEYIPDSYNFRIK